MASAWVARIYAEILTDYHDKRCLLAYISRHVITGAFPAGELPQLLENIGLYFDHFDHNMGLRFWSLTYV